MNSHTYCLMLISALVCAGTHKNTASPPSKYTSEERITSQKYNDYESDSSDIIPTEDEDGDYEDEEYELEDENDAETETEETVE